jgi:hypothetical protein
MTSIQFRAWMLSATVLLVATSTRAAAPAGRYTMPVAGTVLDTKTKLTWQQSIGSGLVTQAAATSYCSALGLAGGGWRLPTVKELLTLVDYSQTGPLIDLTAFPSAPASIQWSATNTWTVSFANGSVTGYASGMYAARCVR